MCYRCEVCGNTVPAGQPAKKHVEYRKVKYVDQYGNDKVREEVDREYKVCGKCDEQITMMGKSIRDLLNQDPGTLIVNNTVPKEEYKAIVLMAKEEVKASYACDVCGSDASDGQIMAGSVLCRKHIRMTGKKPAKRRQ